VKILIADDDRMSRLLLAKTLEREGYEVIAVAVEVLSTRILWVHKR
jgi:CheY-like chemotaxis protein